MRLLSYASDEPDDAAGNGDGNTTNDLVRIDDTHFRVRAERAGSGEGRTYTFTYEAEDAAGNTTTFSTTVVVPHNLKKK